MNVAPGNGSGSCTMSMMILSIVWGLMVVAISVGVLRVRLVAITDTLAYRPGGGVGQES